MWIICMTTNSDGYHMDMKFKRKVPYHFSHLKVIPQKTEYRVPSEQESIGAQGLWHRPSSWNRKCYVL